MGDPAPKKENNRPGDYIIIDDTDSDADSDDDYVDEAGADIMESSSDQNFQTTTMLLVVFFQVVSIDRVCNRSQVVCVNLMCY